MAQDETTVQDTAMQVDHPPQLDPEVLVGAVGAAAQERPLRQISFAVPSETATDRGDSASSGSFDINRLGEMVMRMMKENAQESLVHLKLEHGVQKLDFFLFFLV